jgi:hypothetical protein
LWTALGSAHTSISLSLNDVPPSLGFGAPEFVFEEDHSAGRDVGLAKSGFAIPVVGARIATD